MEAGVPRAHAPQLENPPQREAHTRQLESSPHSPQPEKNPYSNTDAAQSKINKYFFYKKHLRGMFGLVFISLSFWPLIISYIKNRPYAAYFSTVTYTEDQLSFSQIKISKF